jgi:hypothetical protein
MKFGGLRNGFWLVVNGEDGHAVRLQFTLRRFGPLDVSDVWPAREVDDDDE